MTYICTKCPLVLVLLRGCCSIMLYTSGLNISCKSAWLFATLIENPCCFPKSFMEMLGQSLEIDHGLPLSKSLTTDKLLHISLTDICIIFVL
jgi:hypothetical protein